MTVLSIIKQYQRTRAQTVALCKHLTAEDMVAQSMPDASPTKWHLAHTTWFFETFILREYQDSYILFDDTFPYLFNSYYETAGIRHARPHRGLLTRPSLQRVLDYREYVDEQMLSLLNKHLDNVDDLVVVGTHHEMQHQELLLTDILHLFSHNPDFPAVFPVQPTAQVSNKNTILPLSMCGNDGGIVDVGATANTFSYDCEQPKHSAYLTPYALANRPISNGEWLAFMQDDAYQQTLLWLSDGWARRQQESWSAPLYWHQIDGEWFQFGLDGLKTINLHAPVCHVSFYEADAFARWAGKRLPREHELEHSMSTDTIEGNFLEDMCFRPKVADDVCTGVQQLYGDVWEWTQSAYLPYPKFKPEQGALGEYNGKFMANQFVLKGGSCATPKMQMRASYRNFFYPHHRWQFSGVRLAEDV